MMQTQGTVDLETQQRRDLLCPVWKSKRESGNIMTVTGTVKWQRYDNFHAMIPHEISSQKAVKSGCSANQKGYRKHSHKHFQSWWTGLKCDGIWVQSSWHSTSVIKIDWLICILWFSNLNIRINISSRIEKEFRYNFTFYTKSIIFPLESSVGANRTARCSRDIPWRYPNMYVSGAACRYATEH